MPALRMRALFQNPRTAGQTWTELSGLRKARLGGHSGKPGAGGNVFAYDHSRSGQSEADLYCDFSAAGRLSQRTTRGESWRPINRGLKSGQMPDPTAEVGHCVASRGHPQIAAGHSSSCRSIGDVMRSDDAGDSWRESERETCPRILGS